MDVRTFGTRNLPSRQVTEAPAHRGGGTRCSDAARRRLRAGVSIAGSGAPPVRRARHDAGCPLAAGGSVAANLKNVKLHQDQNVVYQISNPISAVGGGRQGWLAPIGARVKVAGMSKRQARGHGGPNRRERSASPAALPRLATGDEPAGASRPQARRLAANSEPSGGLRTHAKHVDCAGQHAVTHAGGRVEIVG